jgi:hypothetical protein
VSTEERLSYYILYMLPEKEALQYGRQSLFQK